MDSRLEPRRRATPLDERRREWCGAGGPVPDGAEPILSLARGGTRCNWEGLGRRTQGRLDQVEVEDILWRAVESGLVVVQERRDRRGEWKPYRWYLTAAGEARVQPASRMIDVAAYLDAADDPNHPVLAALRAWLSSGTRGPTATRLAVAIGEDLRAGRLPRERVLSVKVAGASKALRLDVHRAELEDALGLPLEAVVRRSGDAALVAGPIRFSVAGVGVDARGIPPWIALPAETVERMERFEVDATRLVTIENLTPFEEEARQGLGPGSAALYVGGFAGKLERLLLEKFVAAGIRRVDHWGDLDVGGLRILRHIRSLVPVEVKPFRMEPSLLDRLPTQPLTEHDRAALRSWIDDDRNPDRDLAQALLAAGRKAEQEGWLLAQGGFQSAHLHEKDSRPG